MKNEKDINSATAASTRLILSRVRIGPFGPHEQVEHGLLVVLTRTEQNGVAFLRCWVFDRCCHVSP
jgi:hypothetical protein